MQKVKRDQLWDVLRGGEWCRARVVNVLSDRVNLFITEHDAVKENAVMVTRAVRLPRRGGFDFSFGRALRHRERIW